MAECINDFKEAGIRVWMLTGDKGDTAHQIAISCGLYPSSDFAAFKIDESAKSIEEALLASLDGINALPADAQFGLTISGTALITLLANH